MLTKKKKTKVICPHKELLKMSLYFIEIIYFLLVS